MSPPTASSLTPPPPQSSALPPQHDSQSHDNTPDRTTSAQPPSEVSKVIPERKPLLRLELRDLCSEGSRVFLRLVHASVALQDAVDTVLSLLYKEMPASCIPQIRSVTLVLRDMDGVAYTCGLDLDADHKEIHLSTKYIECVPEARQKEEIMGVLVHEMVHCWQHSGFGKAPQGLIEGVADWVRLKAGYAPPHWKRHTDCDWDAGYERTGYFLEWLEEDHGVDVVRKINDAMRECEYDAEKVWNRCCGGKGVEELWELYKKSVDGSCEKKERGGDGEDKNETDEKNKVEVQDEEHAEETEAGESAPEDDASTSDKDRMAERNKARRGGNMYIPLRPKIG